LGTNTYTSPEAIERRSFEIITEGLKGRVFPEGIDEVVKRVIHASADFDYADNLCFSKDVIYCAKTAVRNGAVVITDTNMALAGINKRALARLGGKAHCFISDEETAADAKRRGITRAAASMDRAAKMKGNLIFAIGNAPTALIRLHELTKAGEISPALVIGAPVGFVNVVESKELFIGGSTPYIIARGRKGGSGIVAAIVNAILYQMYEREGF